MASARLEEIFGMVDDKVILCVGALALFPSICLVSGLRFHNCPSNLGRNSNHQMLGLN